MSFNRLIYDSCSYENELRASTGTLAYALDPNKFYNCNACRMTLLTPGNDVSIAKNGNMVDLESDLKGITRKASKCPSLKYLNPCPKSDINMCQPNKIHIRGTPTTKERVIDTTPHHLPSCQMIRYKPISLPPAMQFPTCGN